MDSAIGTLFGTFSMGQQSGDCVIFSAKQKVGPESLERTIGLLGAFCIWGVIL